MGGKIKDATATPQDVMTGKVFYNNEGRQIGTKENPLEIKMYQLRLKAGQKPSEILMTNQSRYYTYSQGDYSNYYSNQYYLRYFQKIDNVQGFLGFDNAGKLLFFLPEDREGICAPIGAHCGSKQLEMLFLVSNGSLYIGFPELYGTDGVLTQSFDINIYYF